MKIPSVTQATPLPAATATPPASSPGDTAPARPVVALPAEDGETLSIVAPPAELLDRLQAEAAATTGDGIAPADELTRQLAAAQRPLNADAAQAEPDPAADSSPSSVGPAAAQPTADVASPDTAAGGTSPAVPPTVEDRQPFKVVLRFKPINGNRWHATIGVGRDGCDPCWEGGDVDDWPEALDSVLGLHAAAEARWATQPRNPRPMVTPTAAKPVTTTSTPARPSAKTTGAAGNASPAGTGTAARSPRSTAAASAPPPTAVPAPVPPPVPAADPTPARGVEKLSLF